MGVPEVGQHHSVLDTVTRSVACATDAELIDAIRAGDSDAFASLYVAQYAFVYRIAERMLRDAGAAEDVVQAVFLSTWRNPPDVRSGSLAAWLTCVTKNRVRDALRSRTSRREAVMPEQLVDVESLHDHVSMRLECVRIRRAVAALPETQRSLIELGFYGERSHAELAEITQLPLGTVKTRIRTGLQKLRFALAAS